MRLVWAFLLASPALWSQGSCCGWAEELVERVRAASYPELSGKDIRVRPLQSESDYLQARFERAMDREAIRHGYASGLKEYRQWLYAHVPADKLKEKLRDYLSPDEIDAVFLARNVRNSARTI